MSRQLHAQTYVWLHVFSCAARHLSFTRCAEELHITPGAVSQQIRQLEERLGFRLFHRRARGVELSAEGQRLAITVNEAYGSIDAEIATTGCGNDHRDFAIALDSIVPEQVVDPQVAAFATAFSGHSIAAGGRRQQRAIA